MFRKALIAAIASFALMVGPAVGQTSRTQIFGRDSQNNERPVRVSDDGSLLTTGGTVACAVQSGTLTATGQTVTIACANAGAYAITVTPNSFVGTLSFTSNTGSPKRINRNGQAPLQVSSLTYRAIDTGVRNYAVAGGNSLVVTATNVTSGSIAVSISATGGVIYNIPIGEFQTSALASLLNGRSFTTGFPGGTLNVPNDSLACINLSLPATATVRLIYEARMFSTDVVTSQQPVRYYVVNNATAGLPTTSAPVNPRGASGYTSQAVATYGQLSALPTGGATGLGGYVPTGGVLLELPLEKTLEPGANQTMCIIGKQANGVGTTSSPSMILGWREQAIN